jgi:DNA (cytosine-5)-methyltransferase 1
MLHISLFSGIGGFDLAAEWIGWTNVASCEIAEFPRKVLQYHFPNAYHHDDIHTLTYKKLNDELTKRFGINWRADDIILSGGFPCQPYSSAGKREGKNDSRHLWPEMLRVIREVKPTWVVGENVYGLVNWSDGLVFNEVHTDLEAEGFEVQAFVLPAAGVNAPHRRDRVWFVAYSNYNRHTAKRGKIQETDRIQGKHWQKMGSGKFDGANVSWFAPDTTGEQCSTCGTNQKIERSWSGNNGEPEIGSESSERLDRLSGLQWNASHTNSKGFQDGIERGATERAAFEEERTKSFDSPRDWANFPTTQPTIRKGDDGISSRLDGITFSKWRNESIKAYGNAVVPQVVYQIFRAIQQYEENKVQQ